MQESLSIVIPCFNEEDYINILIEDIKESFLDLENLEIILVDDGSANYLSDNINPQQELNVQIIRNDINVGQTESLNKGFKIAKNSVIGILDADGQNPPQELRKMYNLLLEKNLDAVIGYRQNRQDNLFKTIPSKIANKFFRLLSKSKIKDLGCSLKVIKKSYLLSISLDGDLHRFIAPILEKRNLKLLQVPTVHLERTTGKTNYGLNRTIPVLIDSLYFYFTNGFLTPKRYVLGKISFYFLSIFSLLSVFVLYQKVYLDIFVHRNPLFLIAIVFLLAATQVFFSSFENK